MYDLMSRLLLFTVAVILVIFNFFRGLPGMFEKPNPTDPSTETTVVETTAVEPSTEYSTTSSFTETSTQPSTAPSTSPATEPATRVPVTYTDKSTTEGGTVVRTINERGMKMFGGKGVDVFNGSDADIESIYACGTTTSNDGDMLGNTSTSSSNNGSFIVKYDSNLNVKWNKIFCESNGAVNIEDVAILKDKNIIAVGYSNASAYASDNAFKGTYEGIIIKLSPQGDIIWKKSFGGSGLDTFNCVCAVGSGFAIGGSTDSRDGSFTGLPEYGTSSAIIMNFDADGNILWNRYLNGKKGASIEGIAADAEKNIFVSCLTGSVDGEFASFSGLFGGYLDTVVLKYDYAGTNKWNYVIASSGRDEFAAIVADGEGGCLVGGHYEKIGTVMPDGTFADIHNCGGTDALVFRINSDGTQRWNKIISGLENDFIYDIAKVQGGYVAVGATYSSNREFSGCGNFGVADGFADFFTPGGKTVGVLTQGGSREDSALCVAVSDGNAIVFGKSVSNDGYFNGYNTHLTDGAIELFGNSFTGYATKYAFRAY